MSDWQDIKLDTLNITLEEYMGWVEDGTLDEKLQTYLVDKTLDQIEAFEAEVKVDFDAAYDELKDLKSGKNDELDLAEDVDDLTLVASLEEEIAEYEEIMSFVRHEGEDALETEIETYNMYNWAGTEDLSISLADYTVGDTNQPVLSITALGGSAEIIPVDAELTDVNEDGVISSLDYDAQLDADKIADSETSQDFFINVPEGFVMRSINTSVEPTEIIFENPTLLNTKTGETGVTVTIRLDGWSPGNGVNLRIAAVEASAVPESAYASIPEDLQKQLYLGEGTTDSVYDLTHQLSMEERVSMTAGYDELVSDDTLTSAMAFTSGLSDESQVKELTKEAMAILFEVFNTTDTSVSLSSVWTDVTDGLLGALDNQLASDVMACLVATLSRNQQYFSLLFTGNLPTFAEDVFLRDGVLSAVEMAPIFLIERYSGGAGHFGGASILGVIDGTSEQPEGTVFWYDVAGNVSIARTEFADMPTTIEGLGIFQDLALSAGWIVDDGTVTDLISDLTQTSTLAESGLTATLTQEMYDDLKGARGWYYEEDTQELVSGGAGTNILDGISDGEMTAAMDALMLAIIPVEGTNPEQVSMSGIAAAIRGYLGSLTSNLGDVIATFVMVMNEKVPGFLESLFAADTGLADFFEGKMEAENEQSFVIQDAEGVVKGLS